MRAQKTSSGTAWLWYALTPVNPPSKCYDFHSCLTIFRYAFEHTLKYVLREGDHLRLIHVQPYREVVDVVAAGLSAVPIYSAGKVNQESVDVVKHYAKICKERGIANWKEDIIMEDGSAGRAICHYLEKMSEVAADDVLLVLGSRELGFFKRAFIGSTSEYCVRNCHCPVSVIKLPASMASTSQDQNQ